MSPPQTSEQLLAKPPAPAPAAPAVEAPSSALRYRLIPRPWTPERAAKWWSLLGLGVAVNLGIVLVAYLLVSAWSKERNETENNPIAVPYAQNKELLDKFRTWPVQEDGRIKPFGTFCNETLLNIVGYEKFQKNDPVAVVLSWMMTFEPRAGSPEPDLGKIEQNAQKMGCDWDQYPFILCNYHELREILWREHYTRMGKPDRAKALTEDEKHGKYMSPELLRNSSVLAGLSEEASRLREAKLSLPMLENKASEVHGRLRAFEQTRAGGQFAVTALDQVGDVWFPFRHMFAMRGPDGAKIWAGWEEEQIKRQPEKFARFGKDGKLIRQEFPETAIHSVTDAYTRLQQAYLSQDEGKLAQEADSFLATAAQVNQKLRDDYVQTTSMIPLELTFNKAVPFRWAWILALVASVVVIASFMSGETVARRVLYWTSMAIYMAALGVAGWGFYCRIAISGRPPVSNMYETIIFVAAMAGVFGMIFELIYRKGLILLAASLVSTLGFVLADQLTLAFDPGIKPLTAVLRSKYWLIIHVLTIVASYAAFALAWALGNINLGLIVFRPEKRDTIKTLSHFCYRAIQVGVVLLFAGTMLGGFWAAESWGRFWGWDPKEVWALIAFMCYIIPLHSRYVGWIKDFGLAACSVLCFAGVMFAWYGVNFILGAGLHSYGFGSGRNEVLYLAGLVNISLVVHAGLRYMSRPEVVYLDGSDGAEE